MRSPSRPAGHRQDRTVRYALLLLLSLLPGLARAQAEALENPGTVSAVQERLYRMNNELTLGVGVLPADAFYKGVLGTVGFTHHFSDSFAWQIGRGTYSYNLKTSLREQLERDFEVSPTNSAFEEQVQWMVGSDAVWSPVYGKMAISNRSSRPAGTVIHSDHGVRFTSWAFTRRARESGLVPSMGSVGDCYDNAVIESFWGRVQTELLDRRRWRTRIELANALFEYLEIFHNRRRRHSALGMLAPIEHEMLHRSQPVA